MSEEWRADAWTQAAQHPRTARRQMKPARPEEGVGPGATHERTEVEP